MRTLGRGIGHERRVQPLALVHETGVDGQHAAGLLVGFVRGIDANVVVLVTQTTVAAQARIEA